MDELCDWSFDAKFSRLVCIVIVDTGFKRVQRDMEDFFYYRFINFCLDSYFFTKHSTSHLTTRN